MMRRRSAARPIAGAARALAAAARVTPAASRAMLAASAMLALGACLAAVTPATTHAAWSPTALVSAVGTVQADTASQPAISADGRFVAFRGSFSGVGGVYRKQLATGALELVAGDDAGDPSISADGALVSFTTTTALDPVHDSGGGCSDVYVRDLRLPADAPGATRLASARDGSDDGLAYAGGAAGSGCPGHGAAAAPRAALSADGGRVVFTVDGASDLTAAAPGVTDTPAAQVAVRDLATRRTRLVSQTRASLGGAPLPVPDGAAIVPAPFDPATVRWASTAALSADGSTVAWMGIGIPAQTPADPAPTPAGTGARDFPAEYAEPLWRRIDDGPAAPTRRVTGGDDPDCGCGGPLATGYAPYGSSGDAAGPHLGTFVALGGFGSPGPVSPSFDSVTPQLSADGRRVAFLSTQPDRGHEPPIPVGRSFTTTANAFVAEMTPGLTRTAALTRLTDWAGSNFADAGASGQIADVAISPDGTRVAFTTVRTSFPHTPPALLSVPPQQGAPSQLYLANLSAGTLELATRGFDDQPADGAAATPAFSGDGATIVFAAGATNLVYGAYNDSYRQGDIRAGHVFVRTLVTPPAVAGVPITGAAPTPPRPSPSWRIDADARRGKNGAIMLDVAVPGTGTVRASATAAVTTTAVATVWRRRRGRWVRVRVRRTRVVRRTVARATGRARGPGVVALTLRPAAAYRAQTARRGGLYATVAVSFAAPGRRTLTRTLQASFPRAAAAPKRAASARPSRGGGR